MNGESLVVEVPAAIRTLLPSQSTDDEIRRWIIESAVIEGYREGRWSHGKVGQLLRLSWSQTEALLQSRGVPLNLTPQDMDEEFATLEQLFDPRPK